MDRFELWQDTAPFSQQSSCFRLAGKVGGRPRPPADGERVKFNGVSTAIRTLVNGQNAAAEPSRWQPTTKTPHNSEKLTGRDEGAPFRTVPRLLIELQLNYSSGGWPLLGVEWTGGGGVRIELSGLSGLSGSKRTPNANGWKNTNRSRFMPP